MKKVFGIIMILSVILTFGSTFAQDQKPMKEKMSAEERAQQKTDHLKTKLSLNDGQAQSVYAIIFEQERQRESELQNRKERAEKMDMSMRDILNDKQMAQFNEMKAERKTEMRKHKGKMRQSKASHSKCCDAK